jgi:hypothetical protein
MEQLAETVHMHAHESVAAAGRCGIMRRRPAVDEASSDATTTAGERPPAGGERNEKDGGERAKGLVVCRLQLVDCAGRAEWLHRILVESASIAERALVRNIIGVVWYRTLAQKALALTARTHG